MSTPSSQRGYRILIIDDNVSIHADIRKILERDPDLDTELIQAKALLFGDDVAASAQYNFTIDSAFQGQEGLERVKQALAADNPYAVAFVDVRMPPGWDGVETIGHLWKCCPELQIVICTAYSDYSWEEMTHQLGHSPNLVVLKKPFDNIEVLQLVHALTEKWDLNRQVQSRLADLDSLVRQRTAELESANGQLKREIDSRIKTEEGLRQSEERFSKAFHATPIPLAIQSLQPELIVDVNDAFLAMLGSDRAGVIGRLPADIGLWKDPELVKLVRQKNQPVRNHPCQLRTLAGEERQILFSLEPIDLGAGPHWLLILQDITKQTKLEAQLRHSQKMEAVGQLAAGVAHDFNNILTVIQGNASLLQEQYQNDADCAEALDDISLATERAARLVRQLLAFSRKQTLKPELLDPAKIVNQLKEMLTRLLGDHITLEVRAPAGLPAIHADSSMMEQIILNLSVNSRDAMPQGGKLIISVETIQITPEEMPRNSEVRAGRYVCFTVSDTGCGISPDLLPRIFDPFFTTKEIGKGTGLGLATVYGIVKQHHGWVEVQSVVNQGTTFRVYLPAGPGASRPESVTLPPETGVPTGTECVLVVEDEERVRNLAAAALRKHGYRVLAAASGAEALEVFKEHTKEVDLLFTDVMMPGNLLGDELATRLRNGKPSLSVLFTSGYTSDLDPARAPAPSEFLLKPYSPGQLLVSIRRCLDQPLTGDGQAKS